MTSVEPRRAASGARLDDELSRALDDALLARVKRHELGIAYFRAAVYGAGALLDAFLTSRASGGESVVAVLARQGLPVVLMSAFAIWLRRGGWRPNLPRYAVAFDLVFSILVFATPALTMDRSSFATVALPTVLPWGQVLVVASGLRFRRDLVWISSAVFAVVYVALAAWVGSTVPIETHAYGLFMLVCTSMGVDRLSVAVKESVRAEVGRNLLGRFLPEQVVRRAFDDPHSIVNEPRVLDVTVLVTDLRGFTSYSEGRPPEEVLAFLNIVQGAIADAVRAEGGTVDKFLGDGMLAVFGAPEPVGEHAARALAALRRIERLPEELRDRLPTAIAIGAGVHSGEIVAGVLGTGSRLEFTVLGDAVNTASRLESMTKERGVSTLVSGAVVERAGRAGLVRLGEFTVRGREAPIELFTLEDAAESARARPLAR